MTGVTFKLYKEMNSLELIVIDDTNLSVLINGILEEYGCSAFCELYEAVRLSTHAELDEYSVYSGCYGIRISSGKVVLWLDGYDGDKAAAELSLSKFADYLEAYRREWLKDFGEDITLPIYDYVPLIDGIITEDTCY